MSPDPDPFLPHQASNHDGEQQMMEREKEESITCWFMLDLTAFACERAWEKKKTSWRHWVVEGWIDSSSFIWPEVLDPGSNPLSLSSPLSISLNLFIDGTGTFSEIRFTGEWGSMTASLTPFLSLSLFLSYSEWTWQMKNWISRDELAPLQYILKTRAVSGMSQ